MKNLSWLGLCLAGAAFATGGEHGNGGNVLVCEQNGVTTVTLYDYYEMGPRGWTLHLPGRTYIEKVRGVFSRLARTNPSRAKLYRRWFSDFLKPESTQFTQDNLVHIPDIGAGTIPVNCEIKTAAQQRRIPLPGDKQYLIDQKLWDRMSEDQRAGLVLHEMIYREGVYWGHGDSGSSRYLNGVLSSRTFEDLSLREYATLLWQLRFENFDAHGLRLSTMMVSFRDDEHVESAVPDVMNFGLRQDAVTYPLYGQAISMWSRDPDGYMGNVTFRPNGSIASFKIEGFRYPSRYGSNRALAFNCPALNGFLVGDLTAEIGANGNPEGFRDLKSVDITSADGHVESWTSGTGALISRLPIQLNGCPVLDGLVRTAE